MTNLGILLVGCDAETSKTAVEAIRMLLSDVDVTIVKNVEEASTRKPAAKTELLVLASPSPLDVSQALDATDAAELPRWAVVVRSSNRAFPTEVETLSSEEWTVRAVRRSFRSALAQHALRRELVRARGDLLAIGSRVAHDMRTQVAGILATSELLREVLSDEEPSRAELTTPILESVDDLGKIIERLSFLTKTSVRETAKKPLDMSDIVFRALQRIDRQIVEKNASVVGPESWPNAAGEAAWIEKIWINLLTNSLTHGGDGLLIELGWTQEGGEHKFWVRDNGCGVTPGKRSQLFQPFHMLHRPNSPRGLGLPIVHRLSALLGGRCGYEPRSEGGSIFYFTLPMVIATAGGVAPPSWDDKTYVPRSLET